MVSKTDDQGLSRTRVLLRHLGMQTSRVILLICFIGLSGLAIGFVLAYPLRFVDYESSGAVKIDQQALAGEIEAADALVSASDLSSSWEPTDDRLTGFGILGASVCANPIDLPTPLSPKEGVVFWNPSDDTTVISQAIRVEKSRSAVEYLNDVRDELEECDTFYQSVEGDRIRVSSSEVDRQAPISDHVTRRYSSANSVQEWSLMAVGDVIVAVQYSGSAAPPPNFLSEIEWSILRRVAPDDFTPGGVGLDSSDVPDSGVEGTETEGGGAADESGGP